MSSPDHSSAMDSDGNIRKRVGKACDRCRLKKSKCDGNNPCSRCKVDNAICCFGERKKSQDKVYPKGYVEMLEGAQNQLVAGLREAYRRLQNGEGWPGAPLSNSSDGHPLTHDILETLGVLKSGDEHFEDNCDLIMQRAAAAQLLPMTSVQIPKKREASSPLMSERSIDSRQSWSPASLTGSPLPDAGLSQGEPNSPRTPEPYVQQPQLYSNPKQAQWASPDMWQPSYNDFSASYLPQAPTSIPMSMDFGDSYATFNSNMMAPQRMDSPMDREIQMQLTKEDMMMPGTEFINPYYLQTSC